MYLCSISFKILKNKDRLNVQHTGTFEDIYIQYAKQTVKIYVIQWHNMSEVDILDN